MEQAGAISREGQPSSLVIGGTGLVGSYIVEQLARRGERLYALSRSRQNSSEINWLQGDLQRPDTLKFPTVTTLYCTADAALLARAIPHLLKAPPRRVVAFSSTSVLTKQNSEDAAEREMIRRLSDAEQMIVAACERQNVGWTILRPTLIYAEGRDTNITPLSHLIRRFGFMPLVGSAEGLRQPVHAEDLAIGRWPRQTVRQRPTSSTRCPAPRRFRTAKWLAGFSTGCS